MSFTSSTFSYRSRHDAIGRGPRAGSPYQRDNLRHINSHGKGYSPFKRRPQRRVHKREPASTGSISGSETGQPTANGQFHPQHGSGGVYVGDGLPPVPAKLAAKIRRGEFVEMGELLPEFWSAPRDKDSDSKRDNKVRHSRKVTDIFTWLQCFCSFVGVRAQPNPELVPELMAYMATIVRVSQDYPGLAWVRYDAAFRRQAALTGDTRWSTINPTLYTVCFTGVAASTARCELCFATSHTERECAQRGDPDPGMKDRLKVLETAILAMSVFSSDTEPQTLQNHKLHPWLN